MFIYSSRGAFRQMPETLIGTVCMQCRFTVIALGTDFMVMVSAFSFLKIVLEQF